jgi:hypothetical protein
MYVELEHKGLKIISNAEDVSSFMGNTFETRFCKFLYNLILNKKILILLILSTSQVFSQNNFEENMLLLKKYTLEKIKLNKDSTNFKSYYIKQQKKLIFSSFVDSSFLSNTPKTRKELVLKNILKGDFYLYSYYPNDSLALASYRKAIEISSELNDTILIVESYKKILKQLSQNRNTINLATSYLEKFKKILYDNNEKATYIYYKFLTLASINRTAYIQELKKGLKIANKTDNDFLQAKYYQLIGLFYGYFKKETDSSISYTNKAKNIFEKKPYQFYKNELLGIYGNIGQDLEDKGLLKKATFFYHKANKIKVPTYRFVVKVKLNEILAENSKKRNLIDSAYYYLKISNLYKDTLNEYNKARSIIDLDKKYQTAEKEKQILISEQKRKQNSNFLIGSLLFIILGGTIAIVTVKSSKRKRKLAEQQNELEYQKNLTLLKEQELTSINAMVHGQEKERKRIAEDLHDNLGSVLATLKLHFENLKINREKKKIDQNQLFDKTESLIDEAYLKVRRIAHAKNAGVIANQGLLIAIKMMAEKISSADKIQIEVIDFGLNKRLENNLEISVFRIVQELITNTIKHAEAQNTTINISQFENILNIIIEDDGKGFDINKIDLKDGMGIQSIKTRIQHLKGTFEVDSTLNKGTSIIINIPVE